MRSNSSNNNSKINNSNINNSKIINNINSNDKKKLNPIPFDIDQDIKQIDLKPIEQKRLDIVYNQLVELELEPSSDDESIEKQYLKLVEKNAEKKKMKSDIYTNSEYVQKQNKKKKENSTNNNFHKKTSNSKSHNDEDADDSNNNNNYIESTSVLKDDNNKKKNDVKIGKKAIRKMLRLYTDHKKYSEDEIEQMIWEVDEDMDGRVSKYEMEKMYKRCIVDKQELEPKKLFYFILFLMFDKENKRSISEEDTLELLRVRNRGDKEFNQAIDEIFYPHGHKPKKNDDEERLNYQDFINIMTDLILKKRDEVKDKRDNYCNHIKEELEKSKGHK